VVLDSLRRSGLDVITMANNHAVDYGPVGLADTLAAIGSHHLPTIGIGANAGQAYAPWYATVRGTRVAVIAASQIHDRTQAAWTAGPASPGIASAGSERLVAAVRGARQRADIVVVYLHWGTEGQECPNAEQRSLAGRLAAAGADAVVGTHAHLLLGAGWLRSAYVGYGLGNFLWWRDNAYSNDTGVLTLTFRAGRAVRGTFTPAKIDARGVPVPADGARAATVLRKLDRVRRCAGLSGRPPG
jgi:poly-gamma-glutamate synthesis protein (capsule biosynthesis protein)